MGDWNRRGLDRAGSARRHRSRAGRRGIGPFRAAGGRPAEAGRPQPRPAIATGGSRRRHRTASAAYVRYAARRPPPPKSRARRSIGFFRATRWASIFSRSPSRPRAGHRLCSRPGQSPLPAVARMAHPAVLSGGASHRAAAVRSDRRPQLRGRRRPPRHFGGDRAAGIRAFLGLPGLLAASSLPCRSAFSITSTS